MTGPLNHRRPLYVDQESLDELLESGRDRLAPALNRLETDAETFVDAEPVSVLDKSETAPSEDPHDYLSQGDYWWPNPDTDDGLPYVRRDGKTNPEIADFDRPRLETMVERVETLSLAAHCFPSNRQRYADAALTHLRTWFLDEETRMNPHLEYGQRVPGRAEGRCYGIIDTRRLRRVTDAVAILASDGAVPPETFDGLHAWMDEYVDWLLRSGLGREESSTHNNHGTWYDVQLLSLAWFADRDDLISAFVEDVHVAERRLVQQLEPDGRQPAELDRTRPVSYSAFNLMAHTELAMLYGALGVDLWEYGANGRSLRAGIEWLVEAIEARRWEGRAEGTDEFHVEAALNALRHAAVGYDAPGIEAITARIPNVDSEAHRSMLRWPPVTLR